VSLTVESTYSMSAMLTNTDVCDTCNKGSLALHSAMERTRSLRNRVGAVSRIAKPFPRSVCKSDRSFRSFCYLTSYSSPGHLDLQLMQATLQ